MPNTISTQLKSALAKASKAHAELEALINGNASAAQKTAKLNEANAAQVEVERLATTRKKEMEQEQ